MHDWPLLVGHALALTAAPLHSLAVRMPQTPLLLACPPTLLPLQARASVREEVDAPRCSGPFSFLPLMRPPNRSREEVNGARGPHRSGVQTRPYLSAGGPPHRSTAPDPHIGLSAQMWLVWGSALTPPCTPISLQPRSGRAARTRLPSAPR